MTIDEAISHLGTYSSTMGSGQTTQAQHEESKRVAIATMRKYLKICKILDKSDNGEQCMYDTIQEIEEVKDGDDE